jgi:hypothetical protein
MCFVSAGLIGSKRAAALQYQSDNFEWEWLCGPYRARLGLSIHEKHTSPVMSTEAVWLGLYRPCAKG